MRRCWCRSRAADSKKKARLNAPLEVNDDDHRVRPDLGCVVGGAIGQFAGAFAGAALGYAIGLHLAFKTPVRSAGGGARATRARGILREEPAGAGTSSAAGSRRHLASPPPAAPAAASAPESPRATRRRRRIARCSNRRQQPASAAAAAKSFDTGATSARRTGVDRLGARLVHRRQPGGARRRHRAVLRRGLPAEVRRRPQHVAHRVPSRRRGARRCRAAGHRLAAARAAARVRTRAAGRRCWPAVPDGIRGAAALRSAAAHRGVCD